MANNTEYVYKKIENKNNKFIAITCGVTRIVFLIGRYVIKIPNLFNSHGHFLLGCYSNYSERRYCKMMKGIDGNKFYNLVVPSLFCSLFGLVQVQRRCIINVLELTDNELERLKDVHGGDIKPTNFGYIGDRLVCLDYGN